ncbi:MAG: PEGA domain-containing protein [Methanosarcinales archaeon]
MDMNRNRILKLVTIVVLCGCVLGIAAGQEDKGTIKITSDPTGAMIEFDGERAVGPMSITPTTITTSPGTHTIKLSHDGYQDWSTSVDVTAGGISEVHGTLTPDPTPTPAATGSIQVSSNPSGAAIGLDGQWSGMMDKTPDTIPDVAAGTHTIALKLEGYPDWSTSVRVEAGRTANVHHEFPAPTPTPTPKPTTGSVKVTSSPSGASVYLDGTYKGTTTLTINDVSPGKHTIRVSREGCEDRSTSVQVTAGDTAYVSLSLSCPPAPKNGYIRVTSSPSSAEVRMDGAYKGTTTVTISNVPVGWHRITLSLSGYHSQSQDVDVSAGSTSYVDITLDPVSSPGSISVTSSPSKAYIDLDGDYTGFITPKTISGVSKGTHIIKLRYSGYYDWSTSVNVASGRTADVYGSLTVKSSQTPGAISVSSTPSGAYVKSLDGISYNGVLRTPCTIPDVNPGTHVIELTLAGYEDWSTSVGVNPGETAAVSATLVPKATPTTGTISVSSEPSGANVYLDNAYKGVTPVTIPDVPTGAHTVELKLDGYSDWTTNVEVTSGSSQPVSAVMAKGPAPTPTPESTATSGVFAICALIISGIIVAKMRRYKKR